MRRSAAAQILDRRALNRATLARQGLLERRQVPVTDLVEHLVGLQAQTPHTAYVGLWCRIEGFQPEALSELIASRRVVRLGLMRSTIHLVSARDAVDLRALIQPVIDRSLKGQFGRRLEGLDMDDLATIGRAYVELQPRTFTALGDHLLERWPDRDRLALGLAIRAAVPLVQVPPRALWGRSGQSLHTSLETWLGDVPPPSLTIDALVARYLGAFGPASVMDAQAWCGLTKLAEVFERLRPQLVTFLDEAGRELFDLPEAPRPDPDTPAPPRLLYDYDNVLLSHADRTRIITKEEAWSIASRTQESISTFTIDGFVAGGWRIRRERDRATLLVKPLRRLSPDDETTLAKEGRALIAFWADDVATHDVRIDLAAW